MEAMCHTPLTVLMDCVAVYNFNDRCHVGSDGREKAKLWSPERFQKLGFPKLHSYISPSRKFFTFTCKYSIGWNTFGDYDKKTV